MTLIVWYNKVAGSDIITPWKRTQTTIAINLIYYEGHTTNIRALVQGMNAVPYSRVAMHSHARLSAETEQLSVGLSQQHISSPNASIFLDFQYDWYFILSLFKFPSEKI